jgi:hypothetical protein
MSPIQTRNRVKANACGCEVCRLHDRLAEVLKERDEARRMAAMTAEIVRRNSLEISYAEDVQLTEFERKTA